MLIAQLSDLHLGFAPGGTDEPNARRLAAAIDAVMALRPLPDLLFATGDLTEHGDADDFARVRNAFAGLPFPVHYMLGNHDRRAGFDRVWPGQLDGGFLHFVVETPALRLVALDTLDEGRQNGGFCQRRAAWLAARLAEARERPTLILLHHPPMPVGVAWMDVAADAAWVARLAAVLDGQRHVVGLVTGHLHRAIATVWNGLPVAVSPSVAPGLALDLSPIDPERPDDRALIVDTPPGFALHRWDGERLLTYFGAAGEAPAARFTPALQGMIGGMMAERGGAA